MPLFRRATESDLPAIIALLADDPLGAARESPSTPEPYRQAFAAIDADPNQLLAVVEDNQAIIGTMQLTFIPGLSHTGAKRGQIESVRIAANRRGERIGESLIAWAIAQCRAQGCAFVQLTSDQSRTAAHRFYTRLGFKPSHLGFKLKL